MATTWHFDGVNPGSLSVTFDSIPGDFYRFGVDADSAGDADAFATGSTLTLTVTGISQTIGQTFGAYVRHGGPGSTIGSIESPTYYVAANIFKFTADSVVNTTGESFPQTWMDDGAGNVSLNFIAAAGITYTMFLVTDADYQQATGGPYTPGSSQTLNVSISPGAGEVYVGVLYDGGFVEYANRLLTGGSAGSGAPGNPGEGGGGGGGPGGGAGGGGPRGIRFVVDVMDHTGAILATLPPAKDTLQWTYRMLNMGGPGGFSCDFSLFTTVDGLPSGLRLITRDLFAPYRTDFMLKMIVDGSDPVPLMGGIITGVNLKSELGIVSVAGKDWAHWLEQPYPFTEVTVAGKKAYELSVDDWLTLEDSNRYWDASAGSSTATITYGATQHDVVNALIVALGSGYDPNYVHLAPVYVGSSWGQSINYQIPWGDQTSVLAHLQAVAKMYDPRGFDFWVDANKTLLCQGPRAINPNSVTPVATIDSAAIISDIDWTNNGPQATETIAIGSGFGNGRPWARSTYGPSVDVYRRWKRIVSFTNPATSLTSGPDVVTGLAAAQGYLDRFPQKELRLQVRPEALFANYQSGGYYSILGEAVRVTYDFVPYHKIDANFIVTSQAFSTDDAGNLVCDLTLDQIYGTITPDIIGDEGR